jgi:acetolactate synthase-1/2/3 large subunit
LPRECERLHSGQPMKLFEAVASALSDQGIAKLFGLMGDANMQYVTVFMRDHAGVFVNSVDEGGAVSMADGYSRISGQVGVVTVTHGPGVTNTLTALTEAARANSSILLLVGDTPPQREHLQWIDLRAAARLTGAGYRQVHAPESVVDDIGIAIRQTVLERRPIVLNIPVSMMDQTIDYVPSKYSFGADEPRRQSVSPDLNAIDAAAGVAATADRPLILAGRGAVLSDAQAELIGLAEVLQAPLATTLMARDYFRGHELDIGLFGTLSHSIASEVISQTDCILAFGAGLNTFTTAGGDLLRGKALVQCDDSLNMLGTRHPTRVTVLSDARSCAAAMRDAISQLESRTPTRRIDKLKQDLASFSPRAEFTEHTSTSTLDMRTAMIVLDEILPARRAVVTDVGRFHPAPWRFLHCKPQDFAYTSHFGSIGLGIATAIGASTARPDRLTVAVVGDGGGMMGMIELTAAVRMELPLVVVVMNDGSYGAEYTKLSEYGLDPKYSLNQWPSFTEMAEALGAYALTVRTAEDLQQVALLVQDRKFPLVVDVKADPAFSPRDFA